LLKFIFKINFNFEIYQYFMILLGVISLSKFSFN